ncbi:NADH-quinone oxidoreductase subunit J [Candidatus Bandiella numerosa]|uniref:NADH-quinone oxidoreductase subunit J n=1 Tax=Candidatus Bandiella numerosa TaxID=2570586 RepID=UPI001EFFA70F|nr:NADH-quinone oxidoreductase subunit J [Candidatus Bandiella numerosa]
MISFLVYFLMMLVLFTSLIVIFSKNPIHSVLFLIATFFCSAILMVMLEAEYIAMTTIIVYVGAVVILFLFVIMMLDISNDDLKKSSNKITPYVVLSSVAFLAVIIYALYKSEVNFDAITLLNNRDIALFDNSLQYIGTRLYTEYILEFQIAGVILFLAMIGSITLVHRKSDRIVKKQNITHQIMRSKEESLDLMDVKSRSGIKI